jgi:orotidine-5'-phosphate decarboxylase
MMDSLWLVARGRDGLAHEAPGIAGDDAVAARQGRRGVKHGSEMGATCASCAGLGRRARLVGAAISLWIRHIGGSQLTAGQLWSRPSLRASNSPRSLTARKRRMMPDRSRSREAQGATEHGAADRLIVALDVPTIHKANELVASLHDVAFAYKIGFHLWMAQGADALIQRLIDDGKKVFIDAKMYDIENTVELAVRTAAQRCISFVTVHHNEKVVRAAVRGRGDSNIKILVVPLLTIFDEENLRSMGIARPVAEVMAANTERALESGCDGVIASPTDDIQRVKDIAKSKGKDLLVATPGVRPSGFQSNDHRRFGTPTDAIRNGADYLIVGRPIYEQPDPVKAASDIIAEIEAAAGAMPHA